MVEKGTEYISKKDFEMILEVNKKTIEVQAEVSSQNEEIIELLNSTKAGLGETKNQMMINAATGTMINSNIAELSSKYKELKDDYSKNSKKIEAVEESNNEIDGKIDGLKKQLEDLDRNVYKIQILFVTGLLSFIFQIVQLFIKK